MKRDTQKRIERKQAQFIERTKKIYPDINFKLFTGKPKLALRLNTLKSHTTSIKGEPIDWAPGCFRPVKLSRDQLTEHIDFENGSIYLQNASSFIPSIVLNPKFGEKVLDMCSAPGGKASHLAAIAHNDIELWVNDNSKTRLLRMQNNLNRLQVSVYKQTLLGIDRLGSRLPNGYFDKILLDAPCSGEGSLELQSHRSMTYWSIAQIKRLQQLQKQAIRVAWKLLKPGGCLVYSTCTMTPEENEAVINWALSKFSGFELAKITLNIDERVSALTHWQGNQYNQDLSDCVRIMPNQIMEAFFVAKLVKSELYYEE